MAQRKGMAIDFPGTHALEPPQTPSDSGEGESQTESYQVSRLFVASFVPKLCIS
jgi:hypothetical protein